MSDKYVLETELDKSLQRLVLNNVHYFSNDLEKAIYIYIKLCQIFSYDNEYYIFDGDDIVAKKHENINNIPNYNVTNNQIICYEFTAIYAKLLYLLEIDFEVKYKKHINHFGGQHTNLTFKYNDFLIYTDSVTSILDGDLFRSKIGLDLVGIMCKNEEFFYKTKFNETLTNIYSKLNNKFYFNYFKNLKIKLNGLDLDEKIYYFTKLSNTMFSNCMDRLSLMLYLKKNILINAENNNCEMLIVKNNSKQSKYTNLYKNQLAFPTMVIITNGYTPYIYIPGINLIKLKVNELKKMFDNNILEYKTDNPKRLTLIK